MDKTRIPDLNLLAGAIKDARSHGEREKFKKMAHDMINVSVPIRSLREDLVGAIRVGDTGAVEKITKHIQTVRQNETYGKSWGNRKGEEDVR